MQMLESMHWLYLSVLLILEAMELIKALCIQDIERYLLFIGLFFLNIVKNFKSML